MTTTTRKRIGLLAVVAGLAWLPVAHASEDGTPGIRVQGHDPVLHYRYLGDAEESGWDLSLSTGAAGRFLPPAAGRDGVELRLGPAVMKTILLGERPLTFTGEWLHDVEADDRFEGDAVMFSTTFSF